MKDIKVSIGLDFLTAFSKIPRDQQRRVREFIEKFFNNPTSSSINYEKIHNVKDKNVRTVRISDSYRAVVIHPQKENIYILVWVDHHDEAMRWAKNKKFDVNKYTGAIQILDYDVIEKLEKKQKKKPQEETTLFSAIKDKYLLKCGVPEPLLNTIKKIKSEAELDSLATYLPQEATEALYMFASGYNYEEVAREMEFTQEQEVAKKDFAAALANENSKRRFCVIEDDKSLTEMLNAPLELWRVFLHPSQEKLVKTFAKGPMKILGGAGTGKTVVAMHRAKYLAEKVFTRKEDKILFTTFSRNLAIDIGENLLKICSYEAIARIEVVNIDAWVNDFLKKQGFSFAIVSEKDAEKYWQDAINLAPEDVNFDDVFYKDEWQQIIQAKEVSSQIEYLKISRVGRGRSISRAIRKKIWPVFEEYRNQLNENGKKEFVDLVRDARMLLEQQGNILPYRSVIIDEGQDMGTEVYKLIRQIIPPGENDIFIVGDGHQSIYRRKVVLGHCGINVRGQRSKKLKLNYRTTEEIRRWAVALLEGKNIDDLDGGQDNHKGYKSLIFGEKPTIKSFTTYEEEFEYIKKHIEELLKNNVKAESICIVSRTNKLLERYKFSLKQANIDYYQISRSDKRDQKGIRIATMHRIKGLEFDYIIIGSVNRDSIPLLQPVAHLDNLAIKEETDICERSLLYVAATRAKREVMISSYGEKSEFLST